MLLRPGLRRGPGPLRERLELPGERLNPRGRKTVVHAPGLPAEAVTLRALDLHQAHQPATELRRSHPGCSGALGGLMAWSSPPSPPSEEDLREAATEDPRGEVQRWRGLLPRGFTRRG